MIMLIFSGLALARQPNIIFVLADDISAKDLSCYNPAGIKLPFVDKLSQEGVLFKNCMGRTGLRPVAGHSANRQISVWAGQF